MTATSNRPHSGEEQSPFLFVPHGETPPADWLARHPGWISFPATLVPRRGDDPGAGSDAAWGSEPSGRTSTRSKRGVPDFPSTHLASLSADAGAIEFPTAGAAEGDPISAFRTMDRVFNNPLGRALLASDGDASSPLPDGRGATAPAQTLPPDQNSPNGYRARNEPERYNVRKLGSMSDQEYGRGTDVVLPDGSFVDDPKSPTGHMRSPVQDLTEVAREGQRVRGRFKEMLDSPKTALAAPGHLLLQLGLNLGQGGEFDYQRRGNTITGFRQFHQFWHVSNFNVGLFAQQTGLTLDETLRTAGLFARLFSKNADPAQPYSLEPDVVEYIRKGFAAGESHAFDARNDEQHR